MNLVKQTHRRQLWQAVVQAAEAVAAVLAVPLVGAPGKCAHQADGVEQAKIPGVGLLLGAQVDNSLKVLG
jgi:hypothetical protein